MSVEGENFTDRVKETKRLKMDLENGINVILVSPRRIGKSSIVRKVMKEITDPRTGDREYQEILGQTDA